MQPPLGLSSQARSLFFDAVQARMPPTSESHREEQIATADFSTRKRTLEQEATQMQRSLNNATSTLSTAQTTLEKSHASLTRLNELVAKAEFIHANAATQVDKATASQIKCTAELSTVNANLSTLNTARGIVVTSRLVAEHTAAEALIIAHQARHRRRLACRLTWRNSRAPLRVRLLPLRASMERASILTPSLPARLRPSSTPRLCNLTADGALSSTQLSPSRAWYSTHLSASPRI
jgi:chromosome segregation ATPase